MNFIVAASFFENPLVVAVVLIAGALINWLAQKRQSEKDKREAQLDNSHLPEGAQTGAAPGGRWPRPASAPPLLQTARREHSPEAMWEEAEIAGAAETDRDRYADSVPRANPPPLIPQSNVAQLLRARLEQEGSEESTLRFQQLKEQGRSPAKAVVSGRRRRRRSGELAVLWRDEESVRRAFIASLVFGPPKGLEP